jgi:hypothetical protein
MAYVGNIHLPATLTKFLDDASVIAITPGWRCKIARHGECQIRLTGFTFPVRQRF